MLCGRLALKTVRFFGKFLGLYADYYVFEVRAKAGPAKDEEAEKKLAEGGSWTRGPYDGHGKRTATVQLTAALVMVSFAAHF